MKRRIKRATEGSVVVQAGNPHVLTDEVAAVESEVLAEVKVDPRMRSEGLPDGDSDWRAAEMRRGARQRRFKK